MSAHAAVGVDDDLAAGEAGIAHGAADDEAAGRVDVVLGVLVQQVLGRDDGFNDVLLNFGAELVVGEGGVLVAVLENSACCVLMTTASTRTGLWLFVVLDRDLRFAVGAEVGHLAGLADFSKLAAASLWASEMGVGISSGVSSVAKPNIMPWSPAPPVSTPCAMSGDCELMVGDDAAGVAVEALERVVVADFADGVADELLHVDVGLGGDFAGNDDEAGAGEGLAGDAAVGVFREAGVEDGVGNLVGDLVGVAFGDGLGGEEETIGVCGCSRQSGGAPGELR